MKPFYWITLIISILISIALFLDNKMYRNKCTVLQQAVKQKDLKIDSLKLRTADNIFKYCDSTFTRQNYRQVMSLLNIKYPEIVEAQHDLESAYFTSNIFKKFNNAGGYRTDKGYIKFNHWVDFMIYTKRFQMRKGVDKYNTYYDFLLDVKYSENDTAYVNYLKKMVK